MIHEYIIEARDLYGAPAIVLVGGLVIGLLFGFASERTDFCSRQALSSFMKGSYRDNPNKLLPVLIAIFTAVASTQLVVALGLDGLDGAVHHETDLRIGGIFIGAVLFAIGMVLARGCVSRLLILTARGNSRALISSIFLALIAWSSITGFLAAPRMALASFGKVAFDFNHHSYISLSIVALSFMSVALLWRKAKDMRLSTALLSGLVGLLVAAGYVVTGYMGADDFEPVAIEGLRFLQPMTETLAWWVYGAALPLKFGLGIIGGTLIGAGVSSFISGRSKVEGFDNAPHPFRYLAGAALMGFGGVVSGGCTIGWLLNNSATGHIGVVLAILGYMTGYKLIQATGWVPDLTSQPAA